MRVVSADGAVLAVIKAGLGDADPQEVVHVHDADRLAALDHEEHGDLRLVENVERRADQTYPAAIVFGARVITSSAFRASRCDPSGGGGGRRR